MVKSIMLQGVLTQIFFIVFVTIDPRLGAKGLSAFIIHRDNPGLIIRPLVKTIGSRTAGIVR